MTEALPDLSVIVVTHNGRDLALQTLHSARAAAGSAQVEWIVVDNGSTDGTPEAILEEFPDVHLVRQHNLGFAAGNNAGLSHAHGRYVLLLNPDTEVRTGTLSDLVAVLDARPRIGLASVVQRYPDGRLQHSVRHLPTVRRQFAEAVLPGCGFGEAATQPDIYTREHDAEWLVGAFLAVRREAIESVGGLDERFFLYSEEKDLAVRVARAGYAVRHLPVMEITHYSGGYERPELMAQLTYSRLLFSRKHAPVSTRWGIRTALALRHAIRAAVFTTLSTVRPAFRVRAAGERAGLAVALGLRKPRLHRGPQI